MLATGPGLPIPGCLLMICAVLACSAGTSAAAAEVGEFDLNQPVPQSAPSTTSANDAGELAKQAQNPVADLITIPFQNRADFGFGPEDTDVYTLSVQPVVPISLNDDWNLITREIVPVIYQEGFTDASDDNFGLGDSTAALFFSPKEPWHGWIWGAGPQVLIPTATDTALGTGKWGAGPTAVVLQQKGPWTAGMLVGHIWSFAGDDDRPYVNQTFLQPFLAYTTKNGFTAYIETETTYDWGTGQWLVPIEPGIAQVLPIGGQYISIEFGPTFYVESPSGGPDWGLRLGIALLLPR